MLCIGICGSVNSGFKQGRERSKMSKDTKMTKKDAAELAKKIIDNGNKYHLPSRKLGSKKKI